MPSQTGSIDLTAQVSANNNAKDYSDTVVDNLEIGGRNLLLNSKIPIPTLAPYNNSAVVKYNKSLDGVDYYTCSGTRYWRINFPTLISGETYNLWFDIARSSTNRPVFVKIGSTEQNVGTALVEAWKRLGLSFVASTDTYAEIRVAIDSTGTQNDYIAALRNVKLEKGDKATDWTPAPEDVNADISAAESSAKGYADTKKTEAISAAATDATNKANAAAQTATNYITADANGISIHMANESNTYQRQTSNSTTFYVGGKKRSEVGADGLKVYVGTTETEIASFGTSARIGKAYVEGATDNESHLELDYHSLRMIDKEGTEYFEVQDLRDESGVVEVVDTFTGDGTTQLFNLNLPADDTSYSVVVSDGSSGTITRNITTVYFSTPPTSGATITVTYESSSKYAKGYTLGVRESGISGAMSFAEGYENLASGPFSHAEGRYVNASGAYSHSEGISTTSSGIYSHAEGSNTTASGGTSHAQNVGTVAVKTAQTAIGTYNTEDSAAPWSSKHPSGRADYGRYAFIIGNGISNGSRSNAFAVRWDGVVEHYGDVPWTNFPLASTADHYSSSKPLKYRKWGNIVNLIGAVVPKAQVAKEGVLTIGTLPEGCRPIGELVELYQGSGTASWMLRITTGGVVTAERYHNASGYQVMSPHTNGSGGAWLTLNCTFIVA